jgi:uncharacterized protein
MPGLDLNWSLVLVGFGIGALVGMTGVGGGSLMTPILIVFFRLPPSIAIGTDLVNAAFTKVAGAFQHLWQGTVDVKIAGSLALGSLPAAILGVALVKVIKDYLGDGGETLLTIILAWTLILVAALMMVRIVFARQLATLVNRAPRLTASQQLASTIVLGFIAGLLVSLTSVGAGSIVMVFLVLLYSKSAKHLVGTDILHAAALAGVSAIGHLWTGDVDFGVMGALLLGSIPGVLLGSRLSVRMPDLLLRVALALTLMFSGMRLIVR